LRVQCAGRAWLRAAAAAGGGGSGGSAPVETVADSGSEKRRLLARDDRSWQLERRFTWFLRRDVRRTGLSVSGSSRHLISSL